VISPPLNAADAIVDDDGRMQQAFRNWAIKVSVGGLVLAGVGSPEGLIEAPKYTLYLDETVPTAPVQYRKMLADIGGDGKQGWIAL
jgi:hypothetical protein